MIDITIARITHVEWVHQLERLLHKDTTSASLPSYHDCELGVWLYGEGLQNYKEIPEIGLLVQSHKLFHVAAENGANGAMTFARVFNTKYKVSLAPY